ncbi:MAG: LysR family transcriptional regulator [Cypionkella sp.]
MIASRRYLPSIPSLLALEAVDRLGSASAAAEDLNLTQGAISRQLQVLEGQLGVQLIIRDRHRLRLTQAAQDYTARGPRRALLSLASASLKLRANPLGGSLNLAILPAFGMHWLAPRLARFAQSASRGYRQPVNTSAPRSISPIRPLMRRFTMGGRIGRAWITCC